VYDARLLLLGPKGPTGPGGDEEASRGAIPREGGGDDQAGGEVVRSTRGGGASPGILEPSEGLPEDRRGRGEGRGFLLRRRPAVYDRIHPPRSGPEQDDQGPRRPLPSDARLPCTRPAGL